MEMRPMASTHWDVSVTEYAEDGWIMSEAAKADYDEEDFYLVDDSYHRHRW